MRFFQKFLMANSYLHAKIQIKMWKKYNRVVITTLKTDSHSHLKTQKQTHAHKYAHAHIFFSEIYHIHTHIKF